MLNQAEKIKQYILQKIQKHPTDIVTIAAKHFSVTRTTIHRHLNYLLKEGKIIKSGTTRNVQYHKESSFKRELNYKINRQLSEFDALKNDFQGVFSRFRKNVCDICTYGFTEIFNNAIEHSLGSKISVTTVFEKDQLIICIQDNGVGVFKTIFEYFHLDDIRESVLHLTKGKMTTNPTHHTGEGIFFTSKAFDRFEIYANNIHYICDNSESDWSVETIRTKMSGSKVCMEISKNSQTELIEVFKKFQSPNNLSFDKTEIIVELARIGEEILMSRSQAKRIILGLEQFHRIVLDFSGVRLIGQGFVDEIFRVFQNAYPQITIEYIHANDDIEFMIKRSLAK